LDKNSATPADNDNIGAIWFNGNDNTGAETTYATIYAVARDVSNGSEDGSLSFGTTNNGAFAVRSQIHQNGVYINPEGICLGTADYTTYAAANTLDDYEEGIWTLKIQGGTSTESFTLKYTKIGRQVYLTSAGVANMATQTLGTGTLSVHADTSLPFTPIASTRSTSVFPLRTHNSNVATSSGFNAGVFELYNSDLHIGRLGDTNTHNNGISGSLQITATNYSAFPFELNLMYLTNS
jgi:hypothetical protein